LGVHVACPQQCSFVSRDFLNVGRYINYLLPHVQHEITHEMTAEQKTQYLHLGLLGVAAFVVLYLLLKRSSGVAVSD
jgi:hypothetical protein